MDDYQSHLRPDRGLFPLSELTARSARDFGNSPAMRVWAGDRYREMTYNQLHESATAIARWLIDHRLETGDRVAVLGENLPEWGAAYLAAQCAGGVVVPLDSLMPPAGIRHILVDSGARFLLATPKFLRDIAEMAAAPRVEQFVNIGSDPIEGALPLAAVIEEGKVSGAILPERSLTDLAAILYTSGTTGHSKGVMLSQRNIISNVSAASRVLHLGPGDTFLSVLPIHHAFECTAGFLLPLYCGCSITYARSMKSAELLADIRNTQVTLMVAVPLLYEKMQAGIRRGIKKKGRVTEALFNLLYQMAGLGEMIGLEIGDRLFRDIRDKAGLASVRYFISGGGPLDPSVGEFFNRLGIRLLQGYGLTETSPITHFNPPWKVRNISVGPPIAGVECRIAEPNLAGVGEILIRGPNVFVGYYKNEEATRETFSNDGWLKTGDLGAIGADGYLRIMGRKKNIIVTGGGKNVYPEEVEHYLNRQRFIAESLVFGAPRESGYGEEVCALIFPDYEQIDLYFEEQGGGNKPTPDDVHEVVRADLEVGQQELAEYKRVRRFRVVTEEFQKTSTRKIKRFLYRGESEKVRK